MTQQVVVVVTCSDGALRERIAARVEAAGAVALLAASAEERDALLRVIAVDAAIEDFEAPVMPLTSFVRGAEPSIHDVRALIARASRRGA